MKSRLRSFLTAAGIIVTAAAFQPALHAQGLGGMFSGFKMNDASDDDEEHSTNITAAAADIDLDNNIIILIGNVVVDDGASKITCNKMTIYLEEEVEEPEPAATASAAAPATSAYGYGYAMNAAPAPAAVSANGNETNTNEAEDEEEDESKSISKVVCEGDVEYIKRAAPGGQDQIARSENAEYDAHKEEIVMTGSPNGDAGGRPLMMQGSNKMYGDEIRILIKEGTRMRVINPDVHYIGKSILSNSTKAGSNR